MIALPWLLLAVGIVIVIVGFVLASLPGQSDRGQVASTPACATRTSFKTCSAQERMPFSSLVIGLGFLCILVSVVWRIVRWVASVP